MTNKEGFTTSIGIYGTSGEWPRPAGTRSSEHAILVLLTDHIATGESTALPLRFARPVLIMSMNFRVKN